MAIAWPIKFQDILDEEGFSINLGDSNVRTEMDEGPRKVRRRFTDRIDTQNCRITVKIDDYPDFLTFYETTLSSGSLDFEYTDPLTGNSQVYRFAAAPSTTPLGGRYMVINMIWETVP